MTVDSLRALTFRAGLQVVLQALPPEARPGKVVAKKVLEAVLKARRRAAGDVAPGGEDDVEGALWRDFVRRAVPDADVESLGVDEASARPLPAIAIARLRCPSLSVRFRPPLALPPDVARPVRLALEIRRGFPRPEGRPRCPARGEPACCRPTVFDGWLQ